MSDPLNHDLLPDDLFRNRIAAALQELDQPESDADIAAALDAMDAEPLDDSAVGRIMRQVRRSISEADSNSLSGISRNALASGSDLRRASKPGASAPRVIELPARLTRLAIVVACAALVAVGLVFKRSDDVERPSLRLGELLSSSDRRPGHRRIQSAQSASNAAIQRVRFGETLSTGPREKRCVTLLDGSVLSINELSRVAISGKRRVKRLAGEVFVEVMPTKDSERFVVETPHRTVTALGTKFVVKTQEEATRVVVTQGKVQVSGVEEVIPAGQELIADLNESKSAELRPAKRSAYVVEWVKDLMAAVGSIVVPTSGHAGGTVTVVDPNGQEMKLSLRKFHVDAHIEEGFARTTIDQTYFNHTWQQLEGTFRFPLPADASLSRLAMYVNGKLMEGGMVERDYGRNVFEQIRHTRRAPALLEWVDGSTFQMRVFPLEARQEKRILLSYTQRLPSDYGKSVYRFPSGHNLEGVREWSMNLRVKDAAGTNWYSPSHLLNGRNDNGDLVIDGRQEYAALDRDLVVEFGEEIKEKPPVQLEEVIRRPMEKIRGRAPFGSQHPMWSVCEQDGFQYVMLRYRPELAAARQRSPRQWIFLVENSADRNEILAETQQQIANILLENAEHSDTFSIIRAGTQAESFRRKPVECTLENVSAAQQFLKEVAPIGALDLEQALRAVQKQVRGKHDAWIVHLGTGIPVLGERDETTLLRLLPAKARYVGVAVGKRWSKSFMESAAIHSGGHATQINPDEAVAWRAFDLLSTLNAPRLTEITVRSADAVSAREGEAPAEPRAGKKPGSAGALPSQFLLLTSSLAHGQELAALARFPKGQPLPKSVLVTGKLDGQTNQSILEVPNPSHCGHLPRTWARLEIDRLVALGAAENKPQIIELSKSMYVMSPFTSLLVLETEAMYEQFKVDRGRKDHWAMYPAPAEIPVVADQGASQLSPLDAAKERLKLSQARAKSAQSNYERSVTEKRPANDLQRLDRMNRAEQAEVKLIEHEIQRIERANAAAANSIRIAWESVVQRRSAWQQSYLQQASRYHWNYWGSRAHRWNDTDWLMTNLTSEGFDSSALGDDFNVNGVLDPELYVDGVLRGRSMPRTWDVNDDRFGFLPQLNRVLTRDPESRSFKTRSLQGLNNDDGSVTPYFSTFIDGEDFDEARYRLLPILDSTNDYLLGSGVRYVRPNRRYSLRRESELGQQVFGDFRPNSFSRPGRINLNSISNPEVLEAFIAARHDFDIDGRVRQKWMRSQFNNGNDFFTDEYVRPSVRLRSRDGSVFFGRFGEFDVDSDGFVDAAWPLEVSEVVATQERRPIRLMQRGGEGLGYISNGGFIWPEVGGGSVAFDTWHQDFGGYPTVALHPLAGVIQDLPSYAPGLQTWPADRLAIVEQAAAAKPKRGEVDAEARRLIEKARSLGWERCSMAAPGRPAVLKSQTGTAGGGHTTVIADGSGRFVLEREVSEGLKETVIHDGSTLWHLYPEIGLGAKRTLSRFHQSAIQSLIPWYVPSADDLSVEADVKTVGERTIRIAPLKRDELVVELVFAEDGRVSEMRVIEIPGVRRLDAALHSDGKAAPEIHSPKLPKSDERSTSYLGNHPVDSKPMAGGVEPPHSSVIAKQTFAADGTIRLFDTEDKLVAKMKYERQPIEAPNLVPATKELVVLPLPYRSAAGVPVSVPVNLQTNAPDFAKLSDDDALLLLASYFAEARPSELTTFIEQRYTSKGDHRIGLAVLLSAVVPQNPLVANATKQHPYGPLGYFLEQFSAVAVQGNHRAWLEHARTSPFLNRLVSAYNHHSRWSADQAAPRDRAEADIQKELATTLLFIRECRSLDLATKLLSTVQLSLKRTERMNATFARQLNEATAAIAEERGLPAFARTARIEWLLTVGDEASVAQAKELFRTQLAWRMLPASEPTLAASATAEFPILNGDTRAAFVKHFKTPNGQPCGPWGELVKEAAHKLGEPEGVSPRTPAIVRGLTPTGSPEIGRLFVADRLIALTRACVSLSEPALAAEIFQLAIKDQDLVAQPRLNLAALTYAQEANNWELAEACVQRALVDEKLQKVSQLWRDAAHIAEQRRKFDDWIEFLDRAYELEFAALPKTLDLNAFRVEYGNLFNQFDQRTAQLATAKQSEKVAFAHIVQRATARWRDIDVDDTVACHRTAFILAKLGLPTAAWNYWTTPLAETPDRSAVWQSFAIAMHAQQRIAVADQAWTTAFACEPTNPELLLQHAQFLRSSRHEHKARELLTKIINNTWQPRFDSTKQQAQQLLATGGSAK